MSVFSFLFSLHFSDKVVELVGEGSLYHRGLPRLVFPTEDCNISSLSYLLVIILVARPHLGLDRMPPDVGNLAVHVVAQCTLQSTMYTAH